MDSEGYTKIVGRRTDLINRGGENVYPIEVENVIYTHPDVEEVQVCTGWWVCAWGGGCVCGCMVLGVVIGGCFCGCDCGCD